jgi:hypothetical protein
LNGVSAGHLPSQVNKPKVTTNDQKTVRDRGEKEKPLKIRLEENKEKRNSLSTAIKREITPPNLLGIERRIE